MTKSAPWDPPAPADDPNAIEAEPLPGEPTEPPSEPPAEPPKADTQADSKDAPKGKEEPKEPPKEEPPKVEEPKDDPQQKRAAKIFAEISRRETDLQRKEASVKQMLADYSTKAAALEAETKRLQEQADGWRQLIDKDPVAAVEQITKRKWDHIIEHVVSGKKPDAAVASEELQRLQAEFESFRAGLSKEREAAEEARKKAEQAADEERQRIAKENLSHSKATAVAFVRSKADDYPLLSLYPDAEIGEVSYALWEQEHEAYELKEKKQLDFAELFRMLENRLDAQRQQQNAALEAKAKRQAEAESKSKPSGTTAPKANSEPETLTNQLAGERVGRKAPKPGDFSAEDKAAAGMRFLKR